MAYKSFAVLCKGAPDTRVSGFTGDFVQFNGDYTSQNDKTGKDRKWAKSDGCWMAFNNTGAGRWEIYRVDAVANITAGGVVYNRDRANDVITENTVYAWSADVTGPTVYTNTETPAANTTVCYSNPDLTANAATVTAYADEQRTVATYTEDTTPADDPMAGSWKLEDLYMEAVPTKELIIKVPENQEVAIVTIEIYNQSDVDGNIYLYRFDDNGTEIFSFGLGVKSLETIALDHKILLPSKYAMYASSTVNGIKVCVNASQTLVV